MNVGTLFLAGIGLGMNAMAIANPPYEARTLWVSAGIFGFLILAELIKAVKKV